MERNLVGPDKFAYQVSSEIESITTLLGAGFAGKNSSSTACESTVLSVRTIPRTVDIFKPFSLTAATSSRQSFRVTFAI